MVKQSGFNHDSHHVDFSAKLLVRVETLMWTVHRKIHSITF